MADAPCSGEPVGTCTRRVGIGKVTDVLPDWALHSTPDGRRLCDTCYIAYLVDRSIKAAFWIARLTNRTPEQVIKELNTLK